MNGIHDMGGMHGFGAVGRGPEDEASFHAPWELRVGVLMHRATRHLRLFNVDEMRAAIESIPPADYLRSGYYERWLLALEALLLAKGVITADELAARGLAPAGAPAPAVSRSSPAPPAPGGRRFQPGDRVRVRNRHPAGHTRAPRYARGRRGIIARLHGSAALPDTSARGLDPHPEAVYSVRFEAAELWGESGGARDAVYLDLWDSYLEPIGEDDDGDTRGRASR